VVYYSLNILFFYNIPNLLIFSLFREVVKRLGIHTAFLPTVLVESFLVVEEGMLTMNIGNSLVAPSAFFIPIQDKDVPKKFRGPLAKWRQMALNVRYVGPIFWRVFEGFTLKEGAPKAGLCYEAFAYLKNWILKNDMPTKSGYAFFIPRLLEGSASKNVDEQRALMTRTQKKYGLPEYHLSNFGSASMLSGLILAHRRRLGDKSSLDRYAVRTDTLFESGDHLNLSFDCDALRCGQWGAASDRLGFLGVFPLALEPDLPADPSGQ